MTSKRPDISAAFICINQLNFNTQNLFHCTFILAQQDISMPERQKDKKEALDLKKKKSL